MTYVYNLVETPACYAGLFACIKKQSSILMIYMFTINFLNFRRFWPALCCCAALCCSLSQTHAVEREKLVKEFHQKIYPILEKHCVSCHEGDIADGDIDLSQFAGGSGQNLFTDTRIWRKVITEVDERRMPPKG